MLSASFQLLLGCGSTFQNSLWEVATLGQHYLDSNFNSLPNTTYFGISFLHLKLLLFQIQFSTLPGEVWTTLFILFRPKALFLCVWHPLSVLLSDNFIANLKIVSLILPLLGIKVVCYQ